MPPERDILILKLLLFLSMLAQKSICAQPFRPRLNAIQGACHDSNPLDFDLKRVFHVNYITGKAAINFPHPRSTTSGWHFFSYFDQERGVAKVSLAGIHYPDTTRYFGNLGIIGVTNQPGERSWTVQEGRLFMADHSRAAADTIVKWAQDDSM